MDPDSISIFIQFVPFILGTIGLAVTNGTILMVDAAFSTLPMEEVKHKALNDAVFAKVAEFLRKREKIITTILILAEVTPIFGGSLLERLKPAIELNKIQDSGIEVVSVLIIVLITAILKGLGYKFPKQIAVNSMLVLKIASFIVYPIGGPIEKLAHLILGDTNPRTFIAEGIFLKYAQLAQEEDVIDATEHTFIENAVSFSDKSLKSVMTPWSNIFAIDADRKYTKTEFESLFRDAHSRVPIIRYSNLVIKCEGYLLTKELLRGMLVVSDRIPEFFTIYEILELVKNNNQEDAIIVYQATKISEDESISVAWEKFNTRRKTMEGDLYSSIVLVEHDCTGILVGMATPTDLVQEIVGVPMYRDEDSDEIDPRIEVDSAQAKNSNHDEILIES
ncbi:MAG: CNNM domain-containing protein [Patescibacteria group bacterium]